MVKTDSSNICLWDFYLMVYYCLLRNSISALKKNVFLNRRLVSQHVESISQHVDLVSQHVDLSQPSVVCVI